jgi:molecular chaperone DnaK (HSP70)
VAIRDEGTPIALPIGEQTRPFLPSVAALGPNGEVLATGQAAADLSSSPDALVVENIKRCLMYQLRPHEDVLLPEWWDREGQAVRLPDSSVDARRVIAAIIEDALNRAVRASRMVGIAVDRATINGMPAAFGCPANSGYDIRQALIDIAGDLELQDISLAEVVDEPSLGAMAFAGLQELGPLSVEPRPRRTVLVYDLGGGTFDVALVDVRPGQGPASLTVLASSSLPFLGGADIDTALLEYLKPRIAVELGVEVDVLAETLSARDWRAVLKATRDLKEELSFVEAAHLALPFLGAGVLIPVDRREFEDVLKASGIVEKTMRRTVEVYREARMYLNRDDGGGFFTWDKGEAVSLAKEDLDAMNRHVTDVILVGGSTRIPAIRQRLESAFPGKIVSERIVDPITANAQGATIVRDGYLPGSLDTCGYWIEVATGGNTTVLHWPFDRYLSYRLGMLPRAVCNMKDIALAAGIGFLRVRDVRGASVEEKEFECEHTETATFEFDDVGEVTLRAGRHILAVVEGPPWQHPFQAAIKRTRSERIIQAQAEAHSRAISNVQRRPWEDTT